MKTVGFFVALLASSMLGCAGGSTGAGGSFALIEFLESGQNNIPRNRQVRFRFSSPVADGQDLFTRLKIQNVNAVPGDSNFARARGFYLLNAEMVIFTPQLPNKPDRTDAGFKADGNYHVFLSGGPDGLTSTSGDTIPTQQEFIFETNQYFEDVIPAEPPRGLQLLAIDPTGVAPDKDLSRADPRAFQQAKLSTQELLDAGNIIDPGAGGGPLYATPWRFELRISETVDPLSVNGNTVQLYEVRENVFADMPDVPHAEPDNPQGDLLVPALRVSATVEVVQSIDSATGDYDIRIRVTPLQTLVDNTRYRLTFSGAVLGIDYRKTFSGDNGLTGDGVTSTTEGIYAEPGGLGYTSEFLVYDRAGINASRTLLYEPFTDGIDPETGQTANTEDDLNSALYNPASEPGTAVGFLSAFGNGSDGPFAVTGSTPPLDTGDTLNEPLGNPFTVNDLNPEDDYLNNTLPGGPLPYDSVEPFEMQVESLTVSPSATFRITGVNPILFRVTGIVQISGTVDVSGENGKNGGSTSAAGGKAGAGGFSGANAKGGWLGSCWPSNNSSTCNNFSVYLNNCSGAKTAFSGGQNGFGPGRGLAGGDGWAYYAQDHRNTYGTSAGGGASHATQGGIGEDRLNLNGNDGTPGICGPRSWPMRLSGVIGVRGNPGPVYGDRLIALNNMGGSGGGSAGAHYAYTGTNFAGGAGGGGGGSLTIVSAGAILVQGGEIDASGGDGGKGAIRNMYTNNSQNWYKVAGGGGGGAGGSIALMSGDLIDLTAADLTTAGGAGGPRATATATKANAGGDGGKGYIFLMDADGDITGFLPEGDETSPEPSDPDEYFPEEYDEDSRGILTISKFVADRFSSITAITELFPMTASKPAYVQYNASKDILGHVANATQFIHITVSSALSNPEDPTVADPTSEDNSTLIATLVYGINNTEVQVMGNMNELNDAPGVADRRAFVRVRAAFDYTNSVEAALGPFAHIDELKISYDFNGN